MTKKINLGLIICERKDIIYYRVTWINLNVMRCLLCVYYEWKIINIFNSISDIIGYSKKYINIMEMYEKEEVPCLR